MRTRTTPRRTTRPGRRPRGNGLLASLPLSALALFAVLLTTVATAAARPAPGDVFREYSWKTEKLHVLSLNEKPLDLPADVDLEDATRAEIALEMANEHMGFEGMAIRLNGNQWYPIQYPESSPKDPSPSLWFHHWYPTIPVALADLKSGTGNSFEMKVPAECFDGKVHPNGNQPLVPWCPVYGVTVRVYYDPTRKPHPTGKVLTPVSQSTLGLAVALTASARSDTSEIRQIDFIGRYEDINYEGDGIYDQWHYHLFHGQITHHLGSTMQPDGRVIWDTSWVPDQPGPIEIAARITDRTGLICMTEAVGGLKLVRPGLSVELCKPFDVPRSFTGCQYGEWVIPGVRTEKFTIRGDLSRILDARYVIASWGGQKLCHGYRINGVRLEDKSAGDDWVYNLSTPPIRPLTALKAGENTFSTVVGPGRVPDIYLPGVQVLIRYRTDHTGGDSVKPAAAEQWESVEIEFTAAQDHTNAYRDVEMFLEFSGPGERKLVRPAFWDGDRNWKVRFAAPATGLWKWRSVCSRDSDSGLHKRAGELQVTPYSGNHALTRHGLLQMSPGKRTVIHQDSTPFLVVADTPWALPFRGTIEGVTEYARDRQVKGFNAALLMSVQPDRDARGPRNRLEVGGFDVGFEDLSEGHLNQLRPEYFQYLDRLMDILHANGIVPVFNPVFQGYGWKGQRTLGAHAAPAEYARYCRYLVARYGARPALWLLSADGAGAYPCTVAGGEEVEKWDAYQQPTGFHYNPTVKPNSMQDAAWLDFQWCQTGHDGKHITDRVRAMPDNLPVKAVANGEPTYEGIRDANNGAGWWQAREAWLNLTAGGTMGIVYGAGGLWQWKLFPDEPGWPAWADAPNRSWREAVQQPGSRYAAWVGRALAGYDFTDMTRLPDIGRQAVGKPDTFYCVYLPEGGEVTLSGLNRELPCHWFNPRTGEFATEGRVSPQSPALKSPTRESWVLLAGSALR